MHIGSQHIKWVCGVSHSVCSSLKVSEGLGIRQAHGACLKAASWGRFQLEALAPSPKESSHPKYGCELPSDTGNSYNSKAAFRKRNDHLNRLWKEPHSTGVSM